MQYQQSLEKRTLSTHLFETRDHFPSFYQYQETNVQSGGTFIRTPRALSLYGNVWNVVELADPYTFDDYSRLQLDFTLSFETHIVAVCFERDPQRGKQPHLCIQVYGDIPRSPSPFLFDNLALGKPTSQSSTIFTGNAAKFAVDGIFTNSTLDQELNSHNMTRTQPEDNPWWEVDLEGLYSISAIILYLDMDIETGTFEEYDPSYLTVILYDDKGFIVFRDLILIPDTINEVSLPLAISASRVKVMLPGEERFLSLSEVVVVESIFGPTRHVDIPIGALWSGETIQYISFLQVGRSALSESYISDMTFVYGYSPDPSNPAL